MVAADGAAGSGEVEERSRPGCDRRPRSVRGDLVRVALPKAAAGALLVGVNVAVARVLGPASYGTFALALTCVLLVDAIAGPSLDLLALRGATPDAMPAVLPIERMLLRLKLIVASVGVAAAIVLGTQIGPWLGVASGDGRLLLLATACSGAALLLLRSAQVRLQLDHRLARYGVSELLYAGGRAMLIAIALAAGLHAPVWLVATGALSAALAATIAWPAVWRTAAARTPLDPAVLKTASLTALTCGVGTIAARVDPFVLGAVASAEDVGLYSAALIAATIVELAGAYAAPALAPRLMPLWHRRALAPFLVRVQTMAALAAIAMLAAAWAILPAAVGFVLPAAYAGSGHLALVLLPAGLAGLVIFPAALNVILMRAPHLFLWIDGVSLAVLIPVWAWAAREHGALGVAWVTSTWRVAKAVIVSVAAMRLARLSPAPVLSSAFTGAPLAASVTAPSVTVPR